MGKTIPINGWSTRHDPTWTLSNAFKTKWVPENESILTAMERKKRHHFAKVVKLHTFKKALQAEMTRQAVQEMGENDARSWRRTDSDSLPDNIIARQPLERIQWLEGEIYNLEHDEGEINTWEHYHQVWWPEEESDGLPPQPPFAPPPGLPEPPPHFSGAEVARSSWQVYQ